MPSHSLPRTLLAGLLLLLVSSSLVSAGGAAGPGAAVAGSWSILGPMDGPGLQSSSSGAEAGKMALGKSQGMKPFSPPLVLALLVALAGWWPLQVR